MLLEQLLYHGFMTGSRAYGTARDDSDYDIVVPTIRQDEINAILLGIERTNSNYNNGFWVQDGEIKINIIHVHPNDFYPWYLTTRIMKSLKNCSYLFKPENRQYFISFFGLTLASFRASLKFRTNDENIKISKIIINGNRLTQNILDESIVDSEISGIHSFHRVEF